MKKKIALITAAAALTACTAFAAIGCGGEESHVLVKVDANEATCVVAGNIEYYKCYDPDCGKLFSDPEGKNEISADSIVITAPGHKTIGIGTAVDPSCTEDGITAGEKCTVCGSLVTAQQVVTKKGHHATKVDGVAPGCETPGTVTYWACADCGKNFLDDECELEASSLTISAIGHAFGDWVPTGDGHHKKVCSNDSAHVETVECKYGKISDFTDGTGHYLICNICEGTTEKLPHEIKWYADPETNEHWGECKSCEYVSDRAVHSPSLLTVEIVGKKMYGGRIMTASDLSVSMRCECGYSEDVATEDITFADTTLVDGVNTLNITVDGFTQEFKYDAPAEPQFALTIVGATVNGETEVMLQEGQSLTQAVTPIAGKTLVGYRTGLTVYDDIAEFVMPDAAATLHALYEEDMIMFAPANKAQSQFSTETYDHVVLDNGIIATRFIWDDDEEAHPAMKYSHSAGDTGTHKVNVYSPAHKSSLMFVYVVNNGDKDVELTYQAENYGVKGEITFTAKAGETTRVPFVYSNEESSYTTFSTCDHRIALASTRAPGETVTLDIYGRLVSTENNKVTAIIPQLDKTTYAAGDKIDLSGLSVSADISGYKVPLYNYTCSVVDGQEWTEDITKIEISFQDFTTYFNINREFDNWIATAVPANPKDDSWISAEHITDAATGLPSTRITFKAGTVASGSAPNVGTDTYVDPTPDKGTGLDYNTSMPQHIDKTRVIKVFVKNTSNQTIKARLYWENYGDIGGADIDLEAGASAVYDVSITAKSPYGTTTGCRINIRLCCDIGEEDASIEAYTMYKAQLGEFTGISVDGEGLQQKTFTVGDTFTSQGLKLAVTSSLGSAGNVRIVNNIDTDLDGHTFTADDVGTKTVTVTWNGLRTTYKITVTAAQEDVE